MKHDTSTFRPLLKASLPTLLKTGYRISDSGCQLQVAVAMAVAVTSDQ